MTSSSGANALYAKSTDGACNVEPTIRPSTVSTPHLPPPMAKTPVLVFLLQQKPYHVVATLTIEEASSYPLHVSFF